jgi:redox-sensitive bicupin YhaK (pirin superfamily)
MRGFQLWINLPAREKMKPASYRDIPAREIPQAELPGGGGIKVIAGTATVADKAVAGPIGGLSTEPLYFDVQLPADGVFRHAVPAQHNAFAYVYEGSVSVGGEAASRRLPQHAAGILADGDEVLFRAGAEGARFILLAARPLHEPVVQYGPFVMNTREQIEAAIDDYQSGKLTAAA